MYEKLLSKMKLFPKILMTAIWINFWFVLLILIWVCPQYRNSQYDAKKHELHSVVTSAVSIIQPYVDLASDGQLTETEAKQLAIQEIEILRFDGGHYLWINDLDNRMVMHPIDTIDTNPELYTAGGLLNQTDSNGDAYIVSLLENIETNRGEGYIEYKETSAGDNNSTTPALAHGILEPSWGWVIATSVPVDDIAEKITVFNLVIGVVSAVIVLITLTLTYMLTRSITRPMATLTRGVHNISEGHIQLTEVDQNMLLSIVERKDEVGDIGNAICNMIDYIQNMTAATQQIADGDLSITITPKSNDDILGNAFADMVRSMKNLLSTMADNAMNLTTASTELTEASRQAGIASSQITRTIQQIAMGISQQSNAVNETAGSIDQMVRAIEGVAKGAQEQAGAVSESSQITSNMSVIIQQVAANAQSSTSGATQAATTARSGVSIVESNLNGMQLIKEKVSHSAERVREMGLRSNEIGSIVETIDDIASQTNLLALNAAIEAARAGEHGKGFAVVADEVRKLAERTASATKEISQLILEVQASVGGAVDAMSESSLEVDDGVARATESGQVLRDILSAVENVTQQVDEIFKATGKMERSSDELVAAMDTVSAIVEENTASTEEMAAGSNEVSQAIEQIASTSEENSASVEEVSASTEEMSAQVQEVSTAAKILAEMAQQISSMLGQFNLGTGDNFVKQINLFRNSHLEWVNRIENMLKGKISLSEDDVCSDHDCILGKWYFGRAKNDYAYMPEFNAIEKPHAELHALFRETIVTYNLGDHRKSKDYFDEMKKISGEVVALLDKIIYTVSHNGYENPKQNIYKVEAEDLPVIALPEYIEQQSKYRR